MSISECIHVWYVSLLALKSDFLIKGVHVQCHKFNLLHNLQNFIKKYLKHYFQIEIKKKRKKESEIFMFKLQGFC